MNAQWAKRGVVEQAPKGFAPDGAFADMLVAIELRAECRLGIVHVPDTDLVEADQLVDLRDGYFVAIGPDEIVAGDVGVTGIEADADGRNALDNLRTNSPT